MLKAAVQGAQINHLLDAVLSVEEVESTSRTAGLPAGGRPPGARGGRDRVPVIQCLDAYAASAFGMRVVWCTATSSVPKDSRASLITNQVAG